VVGWCCTTAFKNAHGTIFRELLYPWHPWFAHRVAVHEAIGKPNEVVFRCTLSGSDAGRAVEIPAWMFDRTVCAAARLTAAPYVNAAALSALRDLLWHALGDPSALSSEPVSGVSRTSPDQNRREALPVSRRECRIKRVSDLPGPQQLDLSGGDRDRSTRLRKRWNASLSKRDYGQCDGNYRRHDLGVDVHTALHLWHVGANLPCRFEYRASNLDSVRNESELSSDGPRRPSVLPSRRRGLRG